MRVIIAAAGTAGHINPGIAIANKISWYMELGLGNAFTGLFTGISWRFWFCDNLKYKPMKRTLKFQEYKINLINILMKKRMNLKILLIRFQGQLIL